ncbi:hypothetical protein [Stenotrophomonas maltophilia]|uniref:Uncharacterized protein n=1 Tax=Stenotrophomonas maltophilia TaxID=40324 RepID=A0A4S2CY48_STEMA|nr:hypothetical protein [Stenotrophomonas maltophilia]TGY33555.1 hypothetical protein E5352_11435 [Stenotrophomonas maltophilia]
MSVWRARLAELTGRNVLQAPSCHLPELPEAPFVSSGSGQNGHSRKSVGTDEMRTRLLALAEHEDMDATLGHGLPNDEVACCAVHSVMALRAYLGALEARTFLDRGLAPPVWGKTVAVTCEGCGPVLLWSECPSTVKACPWCFRRKARKPVARPVQSMAHRWAGQDAEATSGPPYFLPLEANHER